jgi:hypothetical protein
VEEVRAEATEAVEITSNTDSSEPTLAVAPESAAEQKPVAQAQPEEDLYSVSNFTV